VDQFCAKVEEAIDTAALKAGDTYSGVVVAVDPAKGEATVRVGDRIGLLNRKGMGWAGKLGLVNSYGKPAKPSRNLALGAVVEVQVLTPDQNKQGAIFALDQVPEVQGALVAIDPRTGGIKAMVGGYDFRSSQFNRAVQAKRNAGSAFKPIIYAAALEKGLTPATVIVDEEVEYPGAGGKIWKPKNYDGTHRGPVTMREALTHSINIVSVKILDQIGVDYAVEFAKKLGFTSKIEPNLSLALGAASVSPLELTSAYSVFANKGVYQQPFSILRVTDSDGVLLEERKPILPAAPVVVPPVAPVGAPVIQGTAVTVIAQPSAVTPQTAYIVTNLMESVVQSGTGHRASAINRPVAGKTGTTNEMKDAWFVGYIPQLVAGVWVGFDNQERSLGSGGSGGQAAAPIWADFMLGAVKGLPVERFEPPEDITFVRINPKTGRLARGGEGVAECFVKDSEPSSYDGD